MTLHNTLLIVSPGGCKWDPTVVNDSLQSVSLLEDYEGKIDILSSLMIYYFRLLIYLSIYRCLYVS